jgi:hypothetical protein
MSIGIPPIASGNRSLTTLPVEGAEIPDTVYQGQLDPYPKALFGAFRRRGLGGRTRRSNEAAARRGWVKGAPGLT